MFVDYVPPLILVKTKPLCRGLAWLPLQKGKIPIFCLLRHWPYSHSVWLLICLFWFWFDRSSWGSAVWRRWNCDKAIINFFSNFVSQGKIFYKYYFQKFYIAVIFSWCSSGGSICHPLISQLWGVSYRVPGIGVIWVWAGSTFWGLWLDKSGSGL